MDRASPTVGHGTGSSNRASSTASPILHVKATKPQLQWQAQQQHKHKAALSSGQTNSSSTNSNIGNVDKNPVSMNKHKELTTGSSQSSNSSKTGHSAHKIKHHHHLSDHKHKHHKHRTTGLGAVKPSSTSGSIAFGKHRHKKHHHHRSSTGQKHDRDLCHRMESKPRECNQDTSKKSQNTSYASVVSAPGSPSDSGGTGVFRAARELAQLKADLVEIGVDPAGDDGGGSNPSTPSGRKGSGRGRGRQPVQYEEVETWYDEENRITYTKGGTFSLYLCIL